MNLRLAGIAILAVILIAVITAGTAYVVQRSSSDVPVHQESTHTSQPVKRQAPGKPAVSPEPVSSNTGFQTGDNDAPSTTTAPRSNLSPSTIAPSPLPATLPVSRSPLASISATAVPIPSASASESPSPTTTASPIPTTLPPTTPTSKES